MNKWKIPKITPNEMLRSRQSGKPEKDMVYGQDFTVEPLRMVNKLGKDYSKKLRRKIGQRGKDKEPRNMHKNSLQNLRDYRWKKKRKDFSSV